MKKHKILFTAALAVTAAALSCTAFAQEKTVNLQIGSSRMSIDGEVSELDSPPVIADGRTLVPIRAIVEALDGQVDWDNETKTATLTNSAGTEVKLTVNSKTASCNGEEAQLDTAPVIINERTMLPIRFVAESFGYKTDWNAEDKSITISGDEESPAPEKETFDLSGYSHDHYATDKDGNEYITYYKDDASFFDGYLEVKDKNGNTTAVYKRTDLSGAIYKNAAGEEIMIAYSDEVQGLIIVKDDVEKKAPYNDDLYPADEDGNVYTFFNDDEKLQVTDKNGKLVGEYTATGELCYPLTDENGKTACEVVARGGGYEDGFITPDKKYIGFEENYTLSYMGSDGKIYNFKYNYLIVTDDNYKKIEDLKEDSDSIANIFTAKDGTEYVAEGDFAEKYTLKSGSKTITLTCDPEEEHNKVLFAQPEYGSDDDVYYDGDDGRVYVSKDNIFTVYGKDGKEEDVMTMSRYEEKYKSSKGKTYTYSYSYIDDTSCIDTGSEVVELSEIMG